MYLAALAAGIAWLAATRGDEVAELLERARLPLIAAALAATFGLIVLTARFWTVSLRTARINFAAAPRRAVVHRSRELAAGRELARLTSPPSA